MSDVALSALERGEAGPHGRRATHVERPLVRVAAFAALGLYGTLRWSTLISTGSTGRLIGLLALATVVAGGGAVLARRSRLIAMLAAVLAVLAALAIAGLPVAWIVHLRIAVSANAIGEGLSGLPGVLLPYIGIDQWLRMVIVLGAAVLLLSAALLFAFAPRRLGDARRAWIALPLLTLAVVPATLIKPHFPYLGGLVVFGLMAAFLWGERIERGRVPAAVGLCACAAVAAMLAAPAIDPGRPLFDYRALAGSLSPVAVDTFDWSQQYGPVDWPRHGRAVLEVKAASPDYWKAEDLDVFDGRGWTQGLVPGAENLAPAPSSALARFSQQIEVTVRDMRSSDVIGSGFSAEPTDVSQPVVPGFSPGTWTAGSGLGPGDSYAIRVYAPHPSAAELARAGADYAAVPSGYRTILLPQMVVSSPAGRAGLSQPQVVFPPFHSRQPVQNIMGIPIGTGPGLVLQSPYAQAYALARRLAGGARTPYAYALSIEAFLSHRYTYDEDTPLTPYPLETFLFKSRIGYCQQFAGAMALLLRMGGVPARVAVGFTPGAYDSATHRWVVLDIDAHAWVEAWFSGYGWVRFDPTPPADPALGGRSQLPILGSGGLPTATTSGKHLFIRRPSATGAVRRHAGSSAGAGLGGPAEMAALAASMLALLTILVTWTRPLRTGERLVEELERAFARTGRPLAAGVTLAALEHRFRHSPAASGYIRALRLERFGGKAGAPTRGQRRALRAELRAGLGPLGRIRALWALPPRKHPGTNPFGGA